MAASPDRLELRRRADSAKSRRALTVRCTCVPDRWSVRHTTTAPAVPRLSQRRGSQLECVHSRDDSCCTHPARRELSIGRDIEKEAQDAIVTSRTSIEPLNVARSTDRAGCASGRPVYPGRANCCSLTDRRSACRMRLSHATTMRHASDRTSVATRLARVCAIPEHATSSGVACDKSRRLIHPPITGRGTSQAIVGLGGDCSTVLYQGRPWRER